MTRTSDTVFDICAYGAAESTVQTCTTAIQAAIDAAIAAGGGTVHVPAGTFLTGGLVLGSHVTLDLALGATLLGSPNFDDYGAHPGPLADSDSNQRHLLFARDAVDVAITGLGSIDGQGQAFWKPTNRARPDPAELWHDVVAWDRRARGQNERPSPMIELVECKDVRVEGVTLRNSPGWTLSSVACDSVTIRDVVIRNPVDGPNTDGIDLCCSSNVVISGCDIDTGDDAICLKSENPYGDVLVSRNIVVEDCRLSTCCNGFKIGTRTASGFENISVSGLVIHNRDVPLNERAIAGLAIEMVDGGWIDGLTVKNVRMQRVRTPLFVRLGNRGAGQDVPTPGRLTRVVVTDVVASESSATSSITGLAGHHITDITVRDLRIETIEQGRPEWIAAQVPSVEADYPEAFALGKLPAQGLYCRHVTGLRVHGLTVRSIEGEARPHLFCDDVADLDVADLEGSLPEGGAALIHLRDARRVSIRGIRVPAGTETFMQVSGPGSRDIDVARDDVRGLARPICLTDGAASEAVTVR